MTQQRVKQKRFLLFGNYLKNPAKPWEYTSGDVKIAPLWVACFNLLVWQELLKDWWALPFWRRQRGRWFLRKTKINLYEGIWRCSSMDGLMVPKGPWSHFFWNNFSTKKKKKGKESHLSASLTGSLEAYLLILTGHRSYTCMIQPYLAI